MKVIAIALALLFLGSCTERAPGEGDEGTGATGNAEDPTSPTTGALDNPSGFCSPAKEAPGACPADYVCCSDDPAATKGRLPAYYSVMLGEQYGAPIFSANNNVLSYSGQCVDVGGFPSPFASGCPVPCNPTWTTAQRELICGASGSCCPFQALDPAKDCVLDPETNKWRAARGSDIPELSIWGKQHTTNQDPLGMSCSLFAGGGDGGGADEAALADCYAQLSVADQRGFCYASCPCFEDLCDQKNPGWVPRCG